MRLSATTLQFPQTIKRFLNSYFGISGACWQRILLAFINDTSGGVCYFLSLYFVTQLNYNTATAGFIVSCYGLGTVFGGALGGKLADRISPSVISMVSLLIKAVVFLILIAVKSPLPLMISVFILGLGTYGFTTANNVWILNRCRNLESVKLKVINILYTVSNLGIGLSGVLVCGIIQNFHVIFLVSSILLFLSGILLACQKSDVPTDYAQEPDLLPTPSQPANKKLLWITLFCVLLTGLIVTQISATYLIYVKAIFPQMNMKAVGILFVLNPILIVLFQIPLVSLLANTNKMISVGIGAFMVGFGMFMLNFSYAFYIAVIACMVYTAGEMVFFSMSQLVCYNQGDAGKKGQSMGLFKSVYAFSVVLGPTLGGFIYHFYSPAALWAGCGLIGLFCLGLCTLQFKTAQKI